MIAPATNMTVLPKLLPEDVAEIRENYFRFCHQKPPLPRPLISSVDTDDWRALLPVVHAEYQHVQAPPSIQVKRTSVQKQEHNTYSIDPKVFDEYFADWHPVENEPKPKPWKSAPPVHHDGLPDCSGGFKWNNRVRGRRPEGTGHFRHQPTAPPTILEPIHEHTWTLLDAIRAERYRIRFERTRKAAAIYKDRLWVKQIPRKSMKDSEGKKRLVMTYNWRGIECYDPPSQMFQPFLGPRQTGSVWWYWGNWLTTRGKQGRIPMGDLPRVPKDLLLEWQKKLTSIGLPQEPTAIGKIVRRGKPQPELGHDFGVAKPVFDDKRPTGDLWVHEDPEPMNFEAIEEAVYLLNVHFRGATKEDARQDSDAAWLYVTKYDPKTLKELTESKQRQLRRRYQGMKKLSEGKCPSGTCPGDRCANPKLAFAERRDTHAANLPDMIGKLLDHIGEWYCVVDLNGQPRIKWLPDVSKFAGETEDDRVEAAFDELVRQELNAAERQARKDGGDPEAARQRRQATFDAVTELCLLDSITREGKEQVLETEQVTSE